MNWVDAYKVFDKEIFEDYNLFCIFINSIDTAVVCSESESIINQFAKWIDGRVDFPVIANTRLADKLQSKYDKTYRFRYISDIRKCLEEFRDCFDISDKSKYWSINHASDVVNSDNMFERLRKIGEGLVDAQRFYK